MNIKEVLQVFVCKLPKHHQPGKYHENINETTVLDTASMAKVLANKLEKIFQSLFL